MDPFRKIIPIPPSKTKIQRNELTVLIGSCFSESMSSYFKNNRFHLYSNPHGVLFNPISIGDALIHISKTQPDLSQLYFHNEIWHSWMHNSRFSNTSKEALETTIINEIKPIQDRKNELSTIIITLGSAWAYQLKSSGNIVANCHKVPGEMFNKILLTVPDILATFKTVFQIFPTTRFIFTISPVRHWKDGVRENNVSKGILHQAVHELLSYKNVEYFPSYEILLDELRDYRFFTSDYLHPNELATEYIWQRFSETFFDQKTIEGNQEIEKILKSLAHQPQHPTTKSYRQFEEQLSHQRALLKTNYNIDI